MRRRTKKEEDEEVEEILEAAEAMMLLRLTTDSYLARHGSDSLSPDLAGRFNALKAPPSSNPRHQPPPRPSTRPDAGAKAIPDEEMTRALGDDLSARFAALKASSSSPAGESSGLNLRSREEDDSSDDVDVDEEGVSKKEVEKLMQWARDAARLDPSPPPSDDDEDEDDGKQFDVKEYGTSDSDDELTGKKSSGKDLEKKKKKKKKLWF